MQTYYERNQDFHSYVNEFAESLNISVEKALNHTLIKAMLVIYKTLDLKKGGSNNETNDEN